jgi:hypothetical protein
LSSADQRIAILVQLNAWLRERNFVESGHISTVSAETGWRLPCTERLTAGGVAMIVLLLTACVVGVFSCVLLLMSVGMVPRTFR